MKTSRAGDRLSGGQSIAESLVAHGVDTVFGIPGAQTYGLFDGLNCASSPFRIINPRHEQTCAYMALGYAQGSGRPGIFSVVPGPGILNAAAGMLTATGCNAPIMCLTGQIPSKWIGRGRGHLHEMKDQLLTLRQFTKQAQRIEHPAQAPKLIAEGFQEMLGGRPGPVALEMAWDHFTQPAPYSPVAPYEPSTPPAPDQVLIESAAQLCKNAKNPMVMVGGGARNATDAITKLAERLGAPVVAFRAGIGVVDSSHPLSMNIASGHALWHDTDLLIGIGTRLEIPEFRWASRHQGLKVIRIDIDPVELRINPADVAILADSRDGAAALLDEIGQNHLFQGRQEQCIQAKHKTEREAQQVQPQFDYLQAIRTALPPDGFFVDEMCQVGFASWFGFPVSTPDVFITTGYQGTLGYGFPTALGVKVACPDRAVVSVCGDGGFMFAAPELATAVQFGIGVVVIVFDNSCYGNVRRDQRQSFENRLIASELHNPDFVALGESFGVPSARVSTPAALLDALTTALDSKGPGLIVVDVPIDSEASPWPFFHRQ